ncbi:hypothetical protein CDCA_CDCA15G4018 [Cyanidium caldarium]|uniref:Uncharacterized protein n=1 Tax=Cyanidium caldarium TaxID=2771 RepID=A0AAV9J1S8_CYACA|nr:hypothetical protein CDCA_CDCA15G4018 [Cyanidium caldarium]
MSNGRSSSRPLDLPENAVLWLRFALFLLGTVLFLTRLLFANHTGNVADWLDRLEQRQRQWTWEGGYVPVGLRIVEEPGTVEQQRERVRLGDGVLDEAAEPTALWPIVAPDDADDAIWWYFGATDTSKVHSLPIGGSVAFATTPHAPAVAWMQSAAEHVVHCAARQRMAQPPPSVVDTLVVPLSRPSLPLSSSSFSEALWRQYRSTANASHLLVLGDGEALHLRATADARVAHWYRWPLPHRQAARTDQLVPTSQLRYTLAILAAPDHITDDALQRWFGDAPDVAIATRRAQPSLLEVVRRSRFCYSSGDPQAVARLVTATSAACVPLGASHRGTLLLAADRNHTWPALSPALLHALRLLPTATVSGMRVATRRQYREHFAADGAEYLDDALVPHACRLASRLFPIISDMESE